MITTTATIRLPAHVVGLLNKWRRMERALTREFGFAPRAEQIVVALGLTDAQRVLVEKALRASQLRFELGGSEAEDTWSPDEATKPEDAPDALLEADDERKSLLRRLDSLDERERAVLTLRFGLEGEAPLTLREIGERLGVTREWVRKIELRAVRKLDRAGEPMPPSTESRPPYRRHSGLRGSPHPDPIQGVFSGPSKRRRP